MKRLTESKRWKGNKRMLHLVWLMAQLIVSGADVTWGRGGGGLGVG